MVKPLRIPQSCRQKKPLKIQGPYHFKKLNYTVELNTERVLIGI